MALATAIEDLLEDPEKAFRLGVNAQAKFQRQFTLDGMIMRYEQLYLSRLEAA
jgi:hypothetical protein